MMVFSKNTANSEKFKIIFRVLELYKEERENYLKFFRVTIFLL